VRFALEDLAMRQQLSSMTGYIRRLCRRLKTSRPARRPKRPVQLSFEHLEDRRVPALIPVGPINYLTGGFQGNIQTQQAVGIDGFGRSAVAWTDLSGNVYTRLFAADGTPRTDKILVAAGPGNGSARLAMNDNGEFAVAFTFTNSDGYREVFADVFNADGTPRQLFITIAASQFIQEQNPSVAFNDDGKLVVAYEWQSGGIQDVRATLVDTNTGAITDGFSVAVTAAAEYAPSVALNDNGDFVIAYTVDNRATGDQTADEDVYARWYHNYNTDGDPPILVAGGAAFNEASPAVAVSPSGTGAFVVAYTSVSRPGYGNQTSEVYAARYDQYSALQNLTLVAADGAGDFEPSVGTDSSNNFVVAYTVGAGSADQVYVRQYSAAGMPTSSAAQEITPQPQPTPTSQDRPSVAVNPSGQVVAIAEYTSPAKPGDDEVFAQAFKENSFFIQPQWPQIGSDGVPEVDLSNGQSVALPVTIYRDAGTMDMVNLGAANLPVFWVSASQSAPAVPPPQTELRNVTFTAATNLSSSETDMCLLTATGPDGSVAISIPFKIRLIPGSVSNVWLQGAPAGVLVKGTQAFISGAGFLPGSQVQFGTSGWVTPDPPDLQENFIKVTVPSDATDGYVTVKTPAGISYTSPNPVTYQVGAITSIPSTGNSPAGGQWQTVTITGWGFTPGSTVSFGGSLSVTPVSLSETSLDVQVPRDAVDGSITVFTANGALTSTDTCKITNFRNTNGFSYPNFGFKVSFQNVMDAFGLDSWAYLNPVAVTVWGIAAAALNGKGACFGMALLSERLSHGQEPINAAYGLPAGAFPMVFNLMRNGLQDSRNEALLVDQFSSQVIDYWLNWISQTQSAGTIYDQIQAELNKGDQPLVSILNGAPIKDGVPEGHTLLAYDLSPKDDNGNYTIYVYDCNRPFGFNNDERTNASLHRMTENQCEIHVGDTGWSYQMAGNLGTWSGGFDAGRLCVIPYSLVSGNFSLPDLSAIPAGFGWGAIGESRQAMFDQAAALLNDTADLQKWLGPTDFNIQDVNWAQAKALLQTGPQDPITVGADGTVTVTGDKASSPDDTITLNVDANGGAVVTVNNDHWDFLPGTVKAITINPGLGNNVVQVLGTPAGIPVTITGSGGNDTFLVGSAAGTLDTISGPLTINGGAGSSSLTFNDQNQTTAQAYTVTATSFQSSASALITYSGLASVTANGGSGYNTFGVTGTSAAPTTLNGGAGGNLYTVAATTGSLQVNGQGYNDYVQVGGPAGSTLNIQGPINVTNPTGATILEVNDANDMIGRTVTLANGSVTGLSPAPVTWTATPTGTIKGGVGRLVLDGGAGNNTFNVLNTDTFYQWASIVPGTGLSASTVNHVNVQATTAQLFVYAYAYGSSSDVITVGTLTPGSAGNLSGIHGTVTVWGVGDARLVINDQGTTTNQTFAINTTEVGRFDPANNNTADMAPIDYTTIHQLTLYAGTGNNVLGVLGTAAGTSTTVTGGGGNDTFTVGSAAQTLDTISGPLTLNGGAGSSSLTVNDQGNPGITTWTRTPGRLVQQRLDGPTAGSTEIDYTNLPTPVINAGRGLNTLTGNGSLQRTFALGSTGFYAASNAIITDAQGNFYLAGSFQGTVDFDPSSQVQALTAAGTYDGFVAKYAPSGNLVWVRHLASSSGNELDVYGVSVDAAGNVFVPGSFSGTAAIGGTSLSSTAGYDGFVAKLDSSGTFLWAQTLGSGNTDAYNVALDGAGNIYVAGDVTGPATFGGTSFGSANGLVAKLSSSGTVLWAKGVGGSGSDYATSVAVDHSGNVYLMGNFQGTATIGKTTLTSAAGNTFLARLDGSGTVKWAEVLAGGHYGAELALDAAGNLYVAGGFTGTAHFGSTTLTSAGGIDAYVARLNSAGAVQWAHSFGGSGYDYAYGLAVDGSGNVYLSGLFQGTASFGTATFTATGLYNGYLMELDSTGKVSWTKQLAGDAVNAYSLAVDGAGTLDVLGNFEGTANLDPGLGTFNVRSSNPLSSDPNANFDQFILQLAQAGPLTFTGLAGVVSASYRLRQSGSDVQVVDDATGQVLLSKALADTTSVTIQGANGVNTTLTIDFSGGAFTLPVTFTGGTGNNTLVGPNAAETWNLTGANAGKFGTVSFTGVQNLVGGSASDVFKFGAKGSLSGSLSGGGGGDWLDYSGLTAAVTVNLQTGAATGVAGGAAGKVANIQDVHGGNGGNTLTGSAQGNILIGGTGNDRIIGGSGVSLLIGDKGSDTIIGGSGGDILIGGYTTYDTMTTANETALMGILAEWQSADSYATRFHDINTGTGGGLNGTKKLNWGTTVKDDGAADTVTAAASAQALDWFFQGLGDQLFNLQPGEHVNNT
jgi:hypothetical protein